MSQRRNPSASVSQLLLLQMCAITPKLKRCIYFLYIRYHMNSISMNIKSFKVYGQDKAKEAIFKSQNPFNFTSVKAKCL
jgi:hypothetical protein